MYIMVLLRPRVCIAFRERESDNDVQIPNAMLNFGIT
jgi:hypothetical protein